MKKNNLLPYILLAPIILIMGALVFYPVIITFSYSLHKMKLTSPGDTPFVGLKNYVNLLTSESFLYSLQNTLFLLMAVVALTAVFGVAVSLLLNVDTKISGLLTAVAILPWALPPIVNGIIWRFIFHPGYGFMNKLLILLHLAEEPVPWLSERWLLLFIVAIVAAWRSIPFFAIVCLSGLHAVPEELYEAAKIDGGKPATIFRYITAPLIMPFVGIGITSSSITAINIFDEIVALAGYKDLGKNLLIENYLTTFSFLNFGKGSALTYLIMLLSAVLGFFYLKSINKEVEY